MPPSSLADIRSRLAPWALLALAARIERGRRLAREQRIHLAMALGTWNSTRPRPLENKVVLVTPE